MNFDKDTLYYVALGGCGEFGGNLSLYGWNDQWLMVDCGIGFDRHHLAGLARQILMPDPDFIEKRRDKLVGIIVTHAHEDHVGAVPYLWDRFRCPVYLSPFADKVMAEREAELGVEVDGELIEAGDILELGPFKCLMVGVTHSIPEAMMVAIQTPAGTILHTGDWKLDADPLIGEVTQEQVLRELGDKGVLAVVGDSTNANIEGESGEEGRVREGLTRLFETLPQRIVVTMMARHIGRLKAIIDAGHRVGREVCVVGRSLWTMENIARDLNYFDDVPPLLSPKKAIRLPRDRVLFIATGTQGETNAALARMSQNDHPVVRLDKGDTVVFSSRVIPGNEESIALVQSRFRERGIPVVEKDYPDIYSSGHPCRDELRRLYGWVRPKHVLAVHGEPPQQQAHRALVEEMGIEAHTPVNGEVMKISATGVVKVGNVPTAHLLLKSMTTEDGFDYRLERVEKQA